MRDNRIKSNKFCIAFRELVLGLLNRVQSYMSTLSWVHYNAIEEGCEIGIVYPGEEKAEAGFQNKLQMFV